MTQGGAESQSRFTAVLIKREGMDEPIIDLNSDAYFMGEALRQARKAFKADEVPVGAVIARDGIVIARAYNQVETLCDATAHAEMLAITQAESVAERPLGSPIMAVKSPMIRTAWCPKSWNCRSF